MFGVSGIDAGIAKIWWAKTRIVLLICLITSVFPAAVGAHSLGIDRADLVTWGNDEYLLTSYVPEPLQVFIQSPILPERCEFVGAPSGTRGYYSVAFQFRCESRLTGDDVLDLPWRREGVLLTADFGVGEPVTQLSSRNGDIISVRLRDYLVGSGTVAKAASRYLALGFEHILTGLDHLLFVLALMMVVSGAWVLVKTITAFTIAHSITLALATLGFVDVAAAPVEAAIALSIVFLCVEIAKSWNGRVGLSFRHPWAVAFAFGLLHGLGFAGALSEIGLPPDEIPIALVFFNIGVELGQLVFVAAVASGFLILRTALSFGGGSGMKVVERFVIYSVGTVATIWSVERFTTIIS